MTLIRRLALAAFFGWTLIAPGAASADDCANTSAAPLSSPADAMPAQIARNAPPWDSLRIRERDRIPVETVHAELDRIGGSRVLLEIDANGVRKKLLGSLRDDVRKTLRDARINWSNPTVIRGDGVEVRVRDAADVERAFTLLTDIGGEPPDQPSARSVNVTKLDGGLIRLVPTDLAVDERMRLAESAAINDMKARGPMAGLERVAVESAGPGRIAVLLPGVSNPSLMMGVIIDRGSVSVYPLDVTTACDAPDRQNSWNALVVYRPNSKVTYLVKGQELVKGEDIADAVVAFDARSNEPTVVFRLVARAAHRLAEATRETVGQPIAIVFNREIIAMAVISEPLIGPVQMSGGFSPPQAEELAQYLRGNMPPPRLTVLEQQTVAASPAKADP